MCEKVIVLTLENLPPPNFNSTCNNVNALINNLVNEHENGLSLIFPGDLTSTTLSGTIVMSLFDKMEKQMQKLWKIYVKQTHCVDFLLETYLSSFEPLIDNICLLNNETLRELHIAFDIAAKLAPRPLKQIKNIVRAVERCLRRPNQVCMFQAVSPSFFISTK